MLAKIKLNKPVTLSSSKEIQNGWRKVNATAQVNKHVLIKVQNICFQNPALVS
jgi:hypothetical protein